MVGWGGRVEKAKGKWVVLFVEVMKANVKMEKEIMIESEDESNGALET